jgi:hypothetical protein
VSTRAYRKRPEIVIPEGLSDEARKKFYKNTLNKIRYSERKNEPGFMERIREQANTDQRKEYMRRYHVKRWQEKKQDPARVEKDRERRASKTYQEYMRQYQRQWVEGRRNLPSYKERRKEYSKRDRITNRERIKSAARRLNYGLTSDAYAEMLKAQGGVCKVCGRPETRLSRFTQKVMELSVDHCHDTGRVRGLLCGKCNVGLGSFRDSPEALEAAAAYLRASREG